MERPQHLLGADRKLLNADADGVEDGVGDGGRNDRGAGLAEAVDLGVV